MEQKVLDTPPTWQPAINELVWLRLARKDGKVSTFRVRVLEIELDAEPEPACTVEMFPEFELARQIKHPALLKNISPLD